MRRLRKVNKIIKIENDELYLDDDYATRGDSNE